jgi:hypothetical protein
MPLPRRPEVDALLSVAEKALAEITDPEERCRIELAIAEIESRYAPGAAAERMKGCAGRHPDLKAVRSAVLVLAGQDTAVALGMLAGMPQDRREALVAAMAQNQATLDVTGALAIVQTLESRIVREELLLSLLPALMRQDPGAVPVVLDRIIEPLLNDYAMARTRAEAAGAGTPPDAAAVEEGIESRLVKRWALLDVALRVAERFPDAALQLAEGLALPLDRDEVYAATAASLASSQSDKAAALVLRIGDRYYRSVAAEAVAGGMFSTRPALAVHLVQNQLAPARVRPAVVALFSGLCRQDVERFRKAYAESEVRLSPQDEEAVLEACCPLVPREVRRVVSEQREELHESPWYKVCLVCTGLDQDAAATVAGLAGSTMHEAGVSCLARQLAVRSVDEAVQVVGTLADPYSRDRVRFALFSELLGVRNMDRATAVAALLQDRYMSAQAAIAVAAAEVEPDESVQDALAAKLQSIEDSWRRDDLLSQAVRQCSRFPVARRVRLAALVRDAELRLSLYGELVSGIPVGELPAAAFWVGGEVLAGPRADWHVTVCRSVAASPSPQEAR